MMMQLRNGFVLRRSMMTQRADRMLIATRSRTVGTTTSHGIHEQDLCWHQLTLHVALAVQQPVGMRVRHLPTGMRRGRYGLSVPGDAHAAARAVIGVTTSSSRVTRMTCGWLPRATRAACKGALTVRAAHWQRAYSGPLMWHASSTSLQQRTVGAASAGSDPAWYASHGQWHVAAAVSGMSASTAAAQGACQ